MDFCFFLLFRLFEKLGLNKIRSDMMLMEVVVEPDVNSRDRMIDRIDVRVYEKKKIEQRRANNDSLDEVGECFYTCRKMSRIHGFSIHWNFNIYSISIMPL